MLPIILKKQVIKSYYSSWISYRLWRSKTPYLVWQMGKVGSKTIVESLRSICLDEPVFHVHVLSDELIDNGELKKRSVRKGNFAHYRNLCIRNRLLSGISKRRWKIVTLVRDPVGRNVSAFFQNLDLYIQNLDTYRRNNCAGITELADIFLTKFDHDRPIVWFDKELRGVLGFDVFSKPFPKNDGFMIHEGSNYDVLVLKLELLDLCAAEAFQKFSVINDFVLQRSNIGKNKGYSADYLTFIRKLQLPESYLDRLYGSKFANHFYTEIELNEFRSKWI